MKLKPVPDPPADLEGAAAVARALPARADAVDDCCAHLVDETWIASREESATWLVFLRALEIAVETPAGYRRAGDPAREFDGPGPRRAFRERVHGADAVLEVLGSADEPPTLAGVSTALADRDPPGRIGDGERVERLLEWAVLLGLAEREGDRYLVP